MVEKYKPTEIATGFTTGNYWETYQENTCVRVMKYKKDLSYSNIDWYKENMPEIPVFELDELLVDTTPIPYTPPEPFVKTVTMFDIYNNMKKEK